jgi:hypothetical protein
MELRRRNSSGQFKRCCGEGEDERMSIYIKVLISIGLLFMLIPWLYFVIFRLKIVEKFTGFVEENLICPPSPPCTMGTAEPNGKKDGL